MGTTLSLQEIQLAEFDILRQTTDLFRKHKIRYCLAYGTMLGSIRHNGFIPWDDDIDIFVPREDYERLKIILRKEGFEKKYMSFGIPGQKHYPNPYIKIFDLRYRIEDNNTNGHFQWYLWVDIFPLDHFTNNELLNRNLIKRSSKLMNVLSISTEVHPRVSLFKRIIKRLFYYTLGGYRGISRIIDYRARIINKKNYQSNMIGNLVWPQYGKDFVPLDYVTPMIPHPFCGQQFLIPANYEKHLRYFYDDYMQLPPEGKRKRHHIKAYKEP